MKQCKGNYEKETVVKNMRHPPHHPPMHLLMIFLFAEYDFVKYFN